MNRTITITIPDFQDTEKMGMKELITNIYKHVDGLRELYGFSDKGLSVLPDQVVLLSTDPINGRQIIHILKQVADERLSQLQKFGDQQDISDSHSLAVLMEEVGEAAQVVCKREVPPIREVDCDNYTEKMLRDELLQVATVAVAWINRIDNRD